MMVHHSTSGMLFEINEFQLVHALITQHLKGLAETPNTVSVDENDNNVSIDPLKPETSLISTICHTFNSFESSSGKRIFPKSIKDFLSQIRNSENDRSPSTSNKVTSNVEKYVVAPQNQSCVVRYASVLRSSSVQEKVTRNVSKKTSKKVASNVQTKVQQFEKQACSATPSMLSEAVCTKCSAVQVSPQASKPSSNCVVEMCPGGTYYKPVNQHTSSTLPSTPTSSQPSKSLAAASKESPKTSPTVGRSLKRVPSEKFQKMRRKIQKLMSSKRDRDTSEERVVRPVLDELAYLQSIRIPTLAQKREDYESWPCFMLQLPDHVLCQIFSMLDTRTLASIKCTCYDFNFIINNFDIRATDSCWTKEHDYFDDPCKQCRRLFAPGDMSMCRYHPKRYYSDIPYGRSYWMCCFQSSRSAPGCMTGLHDNNWRS
ncbi:uncharacterized protein LOC143462048 isoform X2 [Clavelina lepadiformis]|uniref:F-box domain-containing protein n=1 Tax=Clavelina lepadiformis TaxID=159417 RepID=A0ABP0GKX3_CLALP